MIKKEHYIEDITDALAVLSHKVELCSSINFMNSNVAAEDFYRDFLNLALGYQLKNINSISANAEAIDLGDLINKIAIQVTSTADIKKIKTTVDGFIDKKMYDAYEKLIILNIVKKKSYKQKFVGVPGTFELNTTDDVWTTKTLVHKLAHLDTPKTKAIAEFLKDELFLAPCEKPSKEVRTLLGVIEILSDDDHPAAGKGYIEEPDPDGKINKRFSEHAAYLKKIYVEQFAIYGEILRSIKQSSDLGTIRTQKASLYLKHYSDNILTEHNGDPQAALNAMVKSFMVQIAAKGTECDAEAIRFFLVDELIRCNVFPREAVVYA